MPQPALPSEHPAPGAVCLGQASASTGSQPLRSFEATAESAIELASDSILVFVYGTLRRGEANDINRLHPPPRYVGLGAANGTLYDLGPYPGMVLVGVGRVAGEVYAIGRALEAQLDAIEAAPPSLPDDYAKRLVAVQVNSEHGQCELPCLMYEIHPRCVVGMPIIQSGDWPRR